MQDLLKKETHLAASSIKRYEANCRLGIKLCHLDVNDWETSLRDTDAIIHGFEDAVVAKKLSLATLKGYILAVMKMRKLLEVEDHDDKDLLDLERWIGRQVMKQTDDHVLKPKEAENWRTLDELIRFRDEMEHKIEEDGWNDWNEVKKLLIVSLFTLIPAQRLMPYGAITINGDGTNPLASGHIDRKRHVIVMKKMKSGKTSYELNYEPLQNVMDHWLKHMKRQTWLLGQRDPENSRQTVPLSTDVMGKEIEQAFAGSGKVMNVDLLRKIYVNGTIHEAYSDYVEDSITARLMNHSLETHQRYYNKSPSDVVDGKQEEENTVEEPPIPKRHANK